MPLLLSHRNVDIPLKGNTFQGYYEDEDNRLSTTHLHLELVISICCFWPVSCRSYFASSVLFAFNECLSCVTGAEGQTECLWQVICLNVDYHKRQKASRPQLQTLWTGARRGREDGEAEFSSPHKTTPFLFQNPPHPPPKLNIALLRAQWSQVLPSCIKSTAWQNKRQVQNVDQTLASTLTL